MLPTCRDDEAQRGSSTRRQIYSLISGSARSRMKMLEIVVRANENHSELQRDNVAINGPK